MKTYLAEWKGKNGSFHGFVKADSAASAARECQGRLQAGYVVTDVSEISENAITPQAVCLNFPNVTTYGLF